MISVKLRDFRGCQRADLELAPVALVAGPNAAGKSSIAQATAAALVGNVLPLDWLNKSSAGQLVHVGANHAWVEIASEEGTCKIAWPGCELVTSNVPPVASIWAAGLQSLAGLPPRERAQVLGNYLHAEPEREDFEAAIKDASLPEPVAPAAWALIEAQGWDGALELRKQAGQELKGRWRQVTGHNYGSRIAKTWWADGWREALGKMSEADLIAALEHAKAAHQAAIAEAAVSGAERRRLEVVAAKVEDHKDDLAEAEIAETEKCEMLRQAEAERLQLPPAPADALLACPKCGASLTWRQIDLATRELVVAEHLPAAELRRRRLAIAEADGTVERLRHELGLHHREVERVRNLMHLALDAADRLRKMPAPQAQETDAENLAAPVTIAERELAAWRAMNVAGQIAAEIAANEKLLAILAPDGLRARKLALVLEAWLKTVNTLAAAAGWKTIHVDADMAITYAGRRYELLSSSEQYRVRAVLQVAMSTLDDSDMLVFDAADQLDAAGRSELFQLLGYAWLPALVCMTLSRRAQVPDLAAADVGKSYWLSEGVAHEHSAAGEE